MLLSLPLACIYSDAVQLAVLRVTCGDAAQLAVGQRAPHRSSCSSRDICIGLVAALVTYAISSMLEKVRCLMERYGIMIT